MRTSRRADELRDLSIQRSVLSFAEGSAEVRLGRTRVLCAASVEERVPKWIFDQNLKQGWVTAEYSLLPRSTHTRTQREVTRGRASGRTYEIQRLIGRSLRSVVDMTALGERTVYLDCDVIQADGGTRCAAISGGFVALSECLAKLQDEGKLLSWPIRDFLAAISVGIVGKEIVLDLDYAEDSKAEVDMNVVMTMSRSFVEIQATAEGKAFSFREHEKMLALAEKGIVEVIEAQKKALQGLD